VLATASKYDRQKLAPSSPKLSEKGKEQTAEVDLMMPVVSAGREDEKWVRPSDRRVAVRVRVSVARARGCKNERLREIEPEIEWTHTDLMSRSLLNEQEAMDREPASLEEKIRSVGPVRTTIKLN
jgi:hypothetical protein